MTYLSKIRRRKKIHNLRKAQALDLWQRFLIGFFNGASSISNCGCSALIISEPYIYYHFWWEGGRGSNNGEKIIALWGTLFATKWLHINELQVYVESKSSIDWAESLSRFHPPLLTNWIKLICLVERAL